MPVHSSIAYICLFSLLSTLSFLASAPAFATVGDHWATVEICKQGTGTTTHTFHGTCAGVTPTLESYGWTVKSCVEFTESAGNPGINNYEDLVFGSELGSGNLVYEGDYDFLTGTGVVVWNMGIGPELVTYDGQSSIHAADLPLPQGLVADDPSLVGSVVAYTGESTTLVDDTVIQAQPDFEMVYYTGTLQSFSITRLVVDVNSLTFRYVPEPSSALQLGAGVLVCLLFPRRRTLRGKISA